MPAIKGVRERARAEITAAIKAEATRQLAVDGAGALSLRAVARELGMVSSAVYRYVQSRDDLLTMLIIDAYDGIGAAAEQARAAAAGQPPAERWQSVGRAIRAWACANPHEYALIYGSPVPGYRAPADTIGPASRVTFALLGVVVEARRAGVLHAPDLPMAVPADLHADLVAASTNAGIDLPPEVLARVMVAWSQLFGLISFELFGQTHNVITAHDELFDSATATMAALIGLPTN